MAETQSEQPESFGIEDVLLWAEQHRKQILVATVVTVTAVAAISIYNWLSQQKEADANAAVAAATVGPVADDKKISPDALMRVAADFPGTASAERALILAGSALFEEGKYAEAQSTFAKFLQDHSGSQFASQAAMGLAVALDAQGKADDAIQKYEEIVKNNVNGIGQIKLNLASLYEKQNKPAQALAIYESLAGSQMGTAWASEAEDRKATLLAQHPELAKPAATTTPAAKTTAVPVLRAATTNSTKPKP